MKGRIPLKCMVILILFSGLVLNVLAPPMPPCVFYGYVYVGGKPARDGLAVTAVISGAALNWTMETKNGTYGWPAKGSSEFWILSDDPDTSEKDGGVSGNTVEFFVSGLQLTGQTATFDSGGAIRRDLSVPSTASNQSSLTVAVDCLATYVDYKVRISGRLADAYGLGISGASLLATYAVGGGSPKDIGSFNTGADGNYLVEWVPTTRSGNYSLKVAWEGNEDFERTEASINLALAPLEEQYVFSVISNSTITEIAFNSTNKVLSFTLEGPSGTVGYVNVTIGKDLIAEATGLKIYLDGNETQYTVASSDTVWLLHFTYQHSTHQVSVSLDQPGKPFFETPLGIATLVVIAVAMVLAVVVGFYKKGYRLSKDTSAHSRERKK